MSTEIPYTERCDRCGKTYGDHCGHRCPDEEGNFTLKPPMNTQPDPLAVKCLIDLMVLNRGTGSYEASFETKAHIIISNYLARARQGADTAECDALKASNAELREQLAGNAKLISELQHTVRLVQSQRPPRGDGPCFYCGKPTSSVAGDPGLWPLHFSLEDGIVRVFHAQCVTDRLFGAEHIRECAVKAVLALAKADYIPKNIFADEPAAIICEAFGAPVKDECEEAWLEWVKSIETECHDWESFEAGWKLAKGKP